MSSSLPTRRVPYHIHILNEKNKIHEIKYYILYNYIIIIIKLHDLNEKYKI